MRQRTTGCTYRILLRAILAASEGKEVLVVSASMNETQKTKNYIKHLVKENPIT